MNIVAIAFKKKKKILIRMNTVAIALKKKKKNYAYKKYIRILLFLFLCQRYLMVLFLVSKALN